MSNSHKSSLLVLKNRVLPIDDNCKALFHYDITESDVIKGIAPITNTSTLRSYEGKFGGGVSVENGTTNLWVTPSNSPDPWVNNGGTFENVTLTESPTAPAPNAKTWKLIKTGTDSQWNGWEGEFGAYNAVSGNYFTVSGWYKTTNNAGVDLHCNLNKSGWTGQVNYTILSSNLTIVPDGRWRRFWWSVVINEDQNNIILDAPYWDYSTQAGYLFINGLQWEAQSFPTTFTPSARSDGSLKYNAIDILNIEEGTISCWFKPSHGFFVNNWAAVIAHSTTIDNNCIQLARGASTNKIVAAIANDESSPLGGNWQLLQSTTDIVAGNWYMLTISWKKLTGEVSLYINGVKEAHVSGYPESSFPSNYGTLGVGMHPYYGGRESNGIIDELRIDNIMRTDDEILAWYICGNPFYPKGAFTIAY